MSEQENSYYVEEAKKVRKPRFGWISGIFGVIFIGYFIIQLSILNSNPPNYIKNVAAYKEGSDGLVIYFMLADAGGNMTTADGTVALSIVQDDVGELFTGKISINKSDFRKTKVGMGAFEHDAILYSFGRLPYSRFTQIPKDKSFPQGDVFIEFRTSEGKTLTGKTNINF